MMSNSLALLEHIKQLGVQFERPDDLGDFLLALRIAELKMRSASEDSICSELGITRSVIFRLNKKQIQTPSGLMPYPQLATQVLLVNFFTEERKIDRRSLIYGSFDELRPRVIENQLRIAAGRAGVDSLKPPSYRDQVDAAKGVLNNPITMGYIKLLLSGKDESQWTPDVPNALPPAVLLD